MLVSRIIGLAPTLVALWFTLRKYDYPFVEKTLFDSRRVFLLLAVGIVFGMVVNIFYATILVPRDLLIILLISSGLALFEEMFKFIVLNMKSYQLRFDSVFYGFSLGVGISSTFVLSHVYFSLIGPSPVSPVTWASLVIYSVTLCLIHGSTGTIIGFGAAKGRPWFYFMEAMIVRIFLIIALIPVIADMGEEWLKMVSLIVALFASIYVYRYIYRDVIPDSIPEKIRRRKRLESRRIMKRKT
jgi:hypothetical protein